MSSEDRIAVRRTRRGRVAGTLGLAALLAACASPSPHSEPRALPSGVSTTAPPAEAPAAKPGARGTMAGARGTVPSASDRAAEPAASLESLLAALETTARDTSAERTLAAADALVARAHGPRDALVRLRALELLGEANLDLGRPERAIDAYRLARTTLAQQRARLPGPAFADRARAPLTRLADLLLRRAARAEAGQEGTKSSAGAQASIEATLVEAIEALEDLKGAELREYLGDACLTNLTRATPTDLPDATLLYPVVLDDRTEVLVLGDGRIHRRTVALGADEIRSRANAFRRALQDPTTPRYRATGAALYDVLIRPDEDRLFRPGRTLVWVASDALRTIPLAALYDTSSKRFLIERTAVATLPTLRVAPASPIDPRRARLLALGLAEATADFPALPSVTGEIASLASHFRTTERTGSDFTANALGSALDTRPYDLIHIATHGRFTDRASDRFLLTAEGPITFGALSELIARARHRTARPIELLTLSACETAIGDERASLGLGGLAIEMGARSAIAALWQVNDASTAALFETFYAELAKPGGARGEALRRAQRALLADRRARHPIYWAPFILINGWR